MRAAALVFRLLALACVLLAPVAPALPLPDHSRSVVFVVDRSRSIDPGTMRSTERLVRTVWENRGPVRVGVVAFGARPELVVPIGEEVPERFLGPGDDADGTDLEAAVQLAEAALPDTGARRIVLVTDGRATRGDALDPIHRARARGIEVDVLGVGSTRATHRAVSALRPTRQRVAEGEPVEIVAEIPGGFGYGAQLRWYRGDRMLHHEFVRLDGSGGTEARLLDPDPPPGMHAYRAELGDYYGQTTRSMSTMVVVEGQTRVLVVTTSGQQPGLLRAALADTDTSVDHLSLTDDRLDDERLSAVDLVVLHDLPIEREGEVTMLAGLDGDTQRRLLRWVRERGGGLVVTGGAFGFGPEYADAPLARALPVEIEDRGEIEDPAVAMAIMLDRSGSMGISVGSHSKLQLAIEAALAAASTLRPDDRVGIASVDTVTTWHQRLSPAEQLLARRERIRSMSLGGGGIFVYTALADAYRMLGRAPEPVRHVVLFSDSADSEEQYQGCPFAPCAAGTPSAVELARTGRMAGITTSVVGIGQPTDSDVTFLQDLAAHGGGRYYLTNEATELRRIFVAETRATARSNLVDGPVEVSAADPHPALLGVSLADAPALDGVVAARRRATADTAIVDAEDRPVLASWRYGLGTVVAITTDVGGRWTDPWLTWEGSGQLLRQTLRFAMRDRSNAAADARLAVRDTELELEVDVARDTEGEEVVPATVELFAIDGGANAKSVDATLVRVAPGRWVARGIGSGEPFAVARVRDEHGRLVAEAIGQQDATRELDELGPDPRALGDMARAGGGVLDPEPAALLRGAADATPRPIPTWPWLLLLAALLVCCDLFLRRLGRPRRRPLAALAAAQ